MLFSILVIADLYNNCINLYGKHQFTKIYDVYGQNTYHGSARVFKCSKHNGYWIEKLPFLASLAKSKEEQSTLHKRLGYFAIEPVKYSHVVLKTDRREIALLSDASGDSKFKMNFSTFLSSANMTTTPYTFKRTLVISDVDDTIKISNVNSIIEAAKKLFIKPIEFFDDMVVKYNEWHVTMDFAYVSAGFKQSYDFIKPEMDQKFPKGPLILRSVKLNQRDSTYNFKVNAISEIIESMDNKVALVGDSTQKDAAVYAHLYQKYPSRICKIYIRLILAKQMVKTVAELVKVPTHIQKIFVNGSELPSVIECK